MRCISISYIVNERNERKSAAKSPHTIVERVQLTKYKFNNDFVIEIKIILCFSYLLYKIVYNDWLYGWLVDDSHGFDNEPQY